MNVLAQERLALENDLRRALKREEFELYYQPIIDLPSGRICGAEVLLRWRHPLRGLSLKPADFIPIAEDSGLIVPIGEWTFRQACRQLRTWHAAGHEDLCLAVNLSARQFRQAELAKIIAGTLRESGIECACIEFEITEGVIIQRGEETSRNLDELSAMGLRLSIDDFGIGYSSLSYLKRFPIQALKIDRSFVRDIGTDPSDAAIVTAIVAMAHSLGMRVVAEGVETLEQLEFLTSLGCDKAQGYYFGEPMPVREFERLLARRDVMPPMCSR